MNRELRVAGSVELVELPSTVRRVLRAAVLVGLLLPGGVACAAQPELAAWAAERGSWAS